MSFIASRLMKSEMFQINELINSVNCASVRHKCLTHALFRGNTDEEDLVKLLALYL